MRLSVLLVAIAVWAWCVTALPANRRHRLLQPQHAVSAVTATEDGDELWFQRNEMQLIATESVAAVRGERKWTIKYTLLSSNQEKTISVAVWDSFSARETLRQLFVNMFSGSELLPAGVYEITSCALISESDSELIHKYTSEIGHDVSNALSITLKQIAKPHDHKGSIGVRDWMVKQIEDSKDMKQNTVNIQYIPHDKAGNTNGVGISLIDTKHKAPLLDVYIQHSTDHSAYSGFYILDKVYNANGIFGGSERMYTLTKDFQNWYSEPGGTHDAAGKIGCTYAKLTDIAQASSSDKRFKDVQLKPMRISTGMMLRYGLTFYSAKMLYISSEFFASSDVLKKIGSKEDIKNLVISEKAGTLLKALSRVASVTLEQLETIAFTKVKFEREELKKHNEKSDEYVKLSLIIDQLNILRDGLRAIKSYSKKNGADSLSEILSYAGGEKEKAIGKEYLNLYNKQVKTFDWEMFTAILNTRILSPQHWPVSTMKYGEERLDYEENAVDIKHCVEALQWIESIGDGIRPLALEYGQLIEWMQKAVSSFTSKWNKWKYESTGAERYKKE